MVMNDDFLICYNFWPLLADHAIDATKDYYRQNGVERLHDHKEFDAFSVKLGDVVFVKTDAFFSNTFFSKFNEIENPFVLISAVSSLQVSKEIAREVVNSNKVIKWFCTNPPEINSDKIVPLPIGFEEPSRKGGNQDILKYFLKNKTSYEEKIDRVFLSYHTLNTNSNRTKNYNLIKQKSFVYTQPIKLEIEQYLSMMDKHRFSICFEGAGNDTHRAYETLLVGSVPILKRNSMKKIFDYYKLPAIFVNDWQEIDEKWFDRHRNLSYDFSSVEYFLKSKNYFDLVRSK